MLKLESLALELLEYKTDEVRSGSSVRGGMRRTWQIYTYLLEATEQLDEGERLRLQRVGDVLREHGPESTRPGSASTFAALTLDLGGGQPDPNVAQLPPEDLADAELPLPDAPGVDVGAVLLDDTGAADDALQLEFDRGGPAPAPKVPDSPAVRQERDILKRLARRVWWDDLESFVERVAASWRAERERATARLIYATLRNLGRNRERKTFASDVNLRGFRIEVPIPERSDPLVSFNDLESLAEIVRELVNLVMTLGRPTSSYGNLEIHDEHALAYVREAALKVAADPYAGELSLLPRQGPSASQLRLAIGELAKERLPDDQRQRQRRELERRLAETVAWDRNQRQMFQQDTARFTELIRSFFDRLAKYLPASVGGEASGPQLLGGVLFGVHPALRVDEVPAAAEAITVRLKGPTRFTVAGVEIGVSGSGNARVVFVGGEDRTIAPRLQMEDGDRRVTLFYESDYLHVKVRHLGRSLATLVAEALAVHFVLASDRPDDLITLLKIVVGTVRGEAESLVSMAIERAASVSAKAPDRLEAIEGLLRGAARAARVAPPDRVVKELARSFHTAMTARPGDLAPLLEGVEGEAAVYSFGGEPLNVEIGGVRVTVRQYRGGEGGRPNLVAMVPGQVLGSFSEYLLGPMANGTLLFVRGEQEIAVLHLRGADIAGSRAV